MYWILHTRLKYNAKNNFRIFVNEFHHLFFCELHDNEKKHNKSNDLASDKRFRKKFRNDHWIVHKKKTRHEFRSTRETTEYVNVWGSMRTLFAQNQLFAFVNNTIENWIVIEYWTYITQYYFLYGSTFSMLMHWMLLNVSDNALDNISNRLIEKWKFFPIFDSLFIIINVASCIGHKCYRSILQWLEKRMKGVQNMPSIYLQSMRFHLHILSRFHF